MSVGPAVAALLLAAVPGVHSFRAHPSQPQLRRATVRSSAAVMGFKFPWDEPAPPKEATPDGYTKADEELTKKALSDPKSLTDEELRRVKLELGANWRPRTSTKAGEGYTFFQAPTPKTGVQENMPDFFSKENFEGSVDEIGTTQKVIFGLFAVTFLVVAAQLILS